MGKMTKPDQIPTDLTLDLGGDLAPEDFVMAVRNFFGYVDDITKSQRGDGSEITWTVRVKEGSALVGVEPNSTAPTSRLAMIYKQAIFGPSALAEGNIKNSGLSERAVGYLKSLSDLAVKHGDGRSIKLWVKRQVVSIGGNITRNVQEDWESDYYDYGTLEGRLEAILDANGALKIRIKDFLYPRAISCVVPEAMIDKVLTSFRCRVEIEGRIHYRRNGTPISIEAQEIDVLPEDDQLPTAADVRGIMASA